MAVAPPDARFITGSVPNEMKQGVELIDGVEVAKPTSRVAEGPDGVPERIEQIRFPRPAHIPPGPPKFDATEDAVTLSRSRPAAGALRYDFPLFPDVQCTVVFQGNATADHLEQLTQLLTHQCSTLRAQDARRAETARNQTARRVKTKNAPTTKGRGTKDSQAPAGGEG